MSKRVHLQEGILSRVKFAWPSPTTMALSGALSPWLAESKGVIAAADSIYTPLSSLDLFEQLVLPLLNRPVPTPPPPPGSQNLNPKPKTLNPKPETLDRGDSASQVRRRVSRGNPEAYTLKPTP